MTQPAWPFTLVRPTGYADGSVLTAAEIQGLQERVATAADGRVHTDVAVLKNLRFLEPNAVHGTTISPFGICYDPSQHRWFAFGNVGALGSNAMRGLWTRSGSQWIPSSVVSGTAVTVRSAAANPSGQILVGHTTGASTAAKILRTSGVATSWATSNLGSSNVGQVGSIVWVQALGLWVATQFSTEAGIYTSPDGITWTNRTNSAASGALIVRENPTRIVSIGPGGSPGATTGYLSSEDALTWTAQTFPVNVEDNRAGVYSEEYGAFFVAKGNTLYRSTTGLTGSWTAVHTSTGLAGSVAAFGRALMRRDGAVSVDGGVSWVPTLDTAHDDFAVRAVRGVGAMAVGISTDQLYLTQQAGF